LFGEDPRELARLVGGPVDPVDHDRLGDRLDAIDDVVELDRQVVDVLSIERRDEGVLQSLVDLAIDVVTALLEQLDLGDAGIEVIEPFEHVAQLGRSRLQILTISDE
jgi:hypothetical protein